MRVLCKFQGAVRKGTSQNNVAQALLASWTVSRNSENLFLFLFLQWHGLHLVAVLPRPPHVISSLPCAWHLALEPQLC